MYKLGYEGAIQQYSLLTTNPLLLGDPMREEGVGLAGFEPATHGLGNRNGHIMAYRDVPPSRIFHPIIVRDAPFRVACCRPCLLSLLLRRPCDRTIRDVHSHRSQCRHRRDADGDR